MVAPLSWRSVSGLEGSLSRQAPRALVTDAEGHAALAACRALDAGGYDVAAAASRHLAAAHWSRSCSRRVHLPDPRRDPDGYVEQLSREVRHRRYDVLLPGSEASLIPISEHRTALEPHVLLGLPAHEIVLRSLDKIVLLEDAAAVGLTPPKSRVCTNTQEALRAARDLGYPVVAKPERTFAEIDGRLQERAVCLVWAEHSLERAVQLVGTPLVLQQYIAEAPIVFCAGVRIGERLLGLTVAEFARTWPPDAGTAAMAVTVDPPSGIERQILEILSRIGWTGIFQFQLLDLSGGRFALIDLNPRVFASLALSVRAGANLPTLWCDHLLGRRLAASCVAKSGVRFRSDDGELRYVIRRARSGRFREAIAVLRPQRRAVHSHFALRDPLPLGVLGLMLVVDKMVALANCSSRH